MCSTAATSQPPWTPSRRVTTASPRLRRPRPARCVREQPDVRRLQARPLEDLPDNRCPRVDPLHLPAPTQPTPGDRGLLRGRHLLQALGAAYPKSSGPSWTLGERSLPWIRPWRHHHGGFHGSKGDTTVTTPSYPSRRTLDTNAYFAVGALDHKYGPATQRMSEAARAAGMGRHPPRARLQPMDTGASASAGGWQPDSAVAPPLEATRATTAAPDRAGRPWLRPRSTTSSDPSIGNRSGSGDATLQRASR